MKKTTLTEADKKYIQEHRLEHSMIKMSDVCGVALYHVSKYMTDAGLKLTKKEVMNIRNKSLKKTIVKKSMPLDSLVKKTPVYDFWNYNLNPITMYSG